MNEIMVVLIHSNILNEEIALQMNPEVVVLYEPGRVVYFPSEIAGMKGFTPEQVKAFNMVKREFSPLGPLDVKVKSIASIVSVGSVESVESKESEKEVLF